jgi:NAD(P)-dependent dehydrogenase (short-subunit alcohol dehydrogenase family)
MIEVIDINLKGTFFCIRESLKHIQEKRAIVLISFDLSDPCSSISISNSFL